VQGFNCSANTTYPCQAYALYRAAFGADLSAVGDLFGVSRFMLAHANNLSTSSAPASGQPLLVPLQCGCPSGSPNAFAPTQYQISSGDTFNFTGYVVAAVFFIAATIPLARFTDYLTVRSLRRENGLVV
jgi:hypothetical protein